jgi:hypothetical protein
MNIQEILSQPDGSVNNATVNLDPLELKEKYNVIQQILPKFAIGGTLTIIGIEVFDFARAVSDSSKSIDEINSMIGAVKSMDTLDNIKRFLAQFNFKTISTKRDNCHYVCTTRHEL